VICKSNLSTYLPVSFARLLVWERERENQERKTRCDSYFLKSKTFVVKEEKRREKKRRLRYKNYSHPMSLRREREKERLMQNFEHQLFWVSSTREFSICRLVVIVIMFVLQIDTTFPLEEQSEVTWASKSVTITTISWDSSRQIIPRRVLSSVCRSYLETALLPSSLMALRPLLHPHRPLCPMRFYPPTPVSFLHFVHNLPPLSLFLFPSFIHSLRFFLLCISPRWHGGLRQRTLVRDEGKKERNWSQTGS